jgi:hypothetical protein
MGTLHNPISTLISKSPDFRVWYTILKAFPNKCWEKPLRIFVEKQNIPHDTQRCVVFQINLVRYLYATWLVTPSENLINTEMNAATNDAISNKVYEPKLEDTLRLQNCIMSSDSVSIPNIENTSQLKKAINGNIPVKLQWGICAILEFCNPQQITEFSQQEANLQPRRRILDSSIVEYIVPEHWKNTLSEYWSDTEAKRIRHTLGNLLLLEQPMPIVNGSNVFLSQKMNPKDGFGYKDSIFPRAKLLYTTYTHCNLCTFSPESYRDSQKVRSSDLWVFFVSGASPSWFIE